MKRNYIWTVAILSLLGVANLGGFIQLKAQNVDPYLDDTYITRKEQKKIVQEVYRQQEPNEAVVNAQQAHNKAYESSNAVVYPMASDKALNRYNRVGVDSTIALRQAQSNWANPSGVHQGGFYGRNTAFGRDAGYGYPHFGFDYDDPYYASGFWSNNLAVSFYYDPFWGYNPFYAPYGIYGFGYPYYPFYNGYPFSWYPSTWSAWGYPFNYWGWRWSAPWGYYGGGYWAGFSDGYDYGYGRGYYGGSSYYAYNRYDNARTSNGYYYSRYDRRGVPRQESVNSIMGTSPSGNYRPSRNRISGYRSAGNGQFNSWGRNAYRTGSTSSANSNNSSSSSGHFGSYRQGSSSSSSRGGSYRGGGSGSANRSRTGRR